MKQSYMKAGQQICKVFAGQHTIVVVIVVIVLTATIAIFIVAPPENFTLGQAGSQGCAEIVC